MSVSILIATYGDPEWEELAMSRAYPSTIGQGALEVVIVHLPDGTLAGARNQAARQAAGDWLVFLDADDELCPGYIDEMMRAWLLLAHGDGADHPGFPLPPLLFSPAMPRLRRGRAIGFEIPNAGKWPDANTCCIGTMIPRRLFLDLHGFRDLPSLEDYDLWLRCVKAGARIEHVPGAVYCAHVSPSSRNSDQSIYAQLREEHAEVWAL